MNNEFIPVVIVGAGPTGLAAGNLLGMAGIATLIVERNGAVSDIPKAIALDDEGLRICQAMNLADAISGCTLLDLSVECVSGERLLAKVEPLGRRNGYPLISTFYQPEFEAVLLAGARRFSSVEVRFRHTVEALEQSAGGVIVSIRTPEGALRKVRCAYLLACDGGRSTVRRSLNVSLKGMTFAQRWLVIDAIADVPPAPIVKIFCNPQRPAVAIPAPHNRRRWEFMLLPGETEQDMLAASTVSALLQQADVLPQTRVVRQVVYTFHAARAKTFSQGRVFFLGDAAHMMPPFGGQGLNSGLRDAHNLAWKVAAVLQDRAAPHLLATYHEERARHAARMVAFASILGALFMSTARPLAYCRNLLIRSFAALPITRRYLMEVRIKPRAKYTAGFLIFKGCKKSMVGALLPQPEVITQEGQRVLLDDVLGSGFVLLRYHANPEEAFARINTSFWERIGTRFVCIKSDATPKKSDTRRHICRNTSRHDGELSRSQPLAVAVVRSVNQDIARVSQDYLIAVRPDRFILGIFKADQADRFVSAVQRLLFS